MTLESISYNLISFVDNNEEISYTDCFEVSLLRFLQCIFNNKLDNKLVVDVDRMKYFMLDTPECQQLIEFFKKNQEIELLEKYYQNKKSNGYKLRTEWCQFLNKRSFFRYKIDNKYELCASLHNLFLFFNVFFPKLYLDQPTDNMKIARLAKKLAIDINLQTKISHTKNQFYNTFDLEIKINDTSYNWHLYQYFKNDEDSCGKRITGHSEFTLLD